MKKRTKAPGAKRGAPGSDKLRARLYGYAALIGHRIQGPMTMTELLALPKKMGPYTRPGSNK